MFPVVARRAASFAIRCRCRSVSGNVGGIAALLVHQAGFKVVGISDVHGGIYNAKGLEIPAALKHLQTTRSFEGFGGAERVSNSELLELDCDVLIPAATENQITS